MSIVQTSRSVKSGDCSPNTKDHPLVEPRFSFCGLDAEDGVDDKQYIDYR
jgi:hypothetical protein